MVKRYIYFVSDRNKLVGAQVSCFKTGLTRCYQIILHENLNYELSENLSRSAIVMLVDSFLVSATYYRRKHDLTSSIWQEINSSQDITYK